MIIITGTKRSGTSMWMQILQAAGFQILGEAFPARWDRSIQEANPRGFWESRLRKGIYFETNPDPETGAYLHPKTTPRVAVKVFAQGLVRTDWAFLGRVVMTMRPWRTVVASMRELHRLEDDFLTRAPKRPDIALADEWWLDNYEILRDAAVRRYPFRMVTYERVVEDPRKVLAELLHWMDGKPLAESELDAAVEAVEPSLTRSRPVAEDWPLADLADAWYHSISEQGGPGEELIRELNAAHRSLEERLATQAEAKP